SRRATRARHAAIADCRRCAGSARCGPKRSKKTTTRLEKAMDDGAADRALGAADDAARERALDVSRSFLVQAPAGSGKTELLIQPCYALPAQVERPEPIVAVTFTGKAPGKMRERIVTALRDAETNTPMRSPHGAKTRQLALAALAQDSRHGWQLLVHPSRLAV